MHTEKLLLLLLIRLIISSNILNNKLMVLFLPLFSPSFSHNLMCQFIRLINTFLFFFFILSIITDQSLHIYTFFSSISFIDSFSYWICLFYFHRTSLRNIVIWYKFLLILLQSLSCTLSWKFYFTIVALSCKNILIMLLRGGVKLIGI